MLISPGLCAQIACIWEATARKPGNVHRFCDYEDTSYLDFLLSAAAIAPVLDDAPGQRVGEMVLEAVRATHNVIQSNTNLGIVLLLSPLAVIPADQPLREGVAAVLNDLDLDDARQVYEAIRLASPAGLCRVSEQDVLAEPTQTLREVMTLAADRDLVARQYDNGFLDVFDAGIPALQRGIVETACLEHAIISCHLQLLARYPDSLIVRKRGAAEAVEASRRATVVLDRGWPNSEDGNSALAELDAWLRAEGHERNPGTTADLVTASLFAALRAGIITLPPQLPWTA